MKSNLMVLLLLSSLLLSAKSAPHPFSAFDMVNLDRVGTPAVSPSGSMAAFTRWTYNFDTHTSSQSIWVTSLVASNVTYQITPTTYGISDASPIWLDEDTIAFLSSARTASKTSQLFSVTLDGLVTQLTDYPVSVENFKLFQNRSFIGFNARVYASSSMQETKEIDDEKATDPSTAMVYDRLYFRHWDTFSDHKFSHIFVVPLSKQGNTYAITADPIDVMFGMELESPVLPFGGSADFDFAPDGSEVAFAALRPGVDQAWSTDYNIYIGSAKGQGQPSPITEFNPAQDSYPVYSPDGSKIAYLAMRVPKYEADRRRVVIYDRTTKVHTTLTEVWDRSPESIVWSADSSLIYVTVQDVARENIYVIEVSSKKVTLVLQGGYHSGLSITPRGLTFARNNQLAPNEIFTFENSILVQRTFVNQEKLADIITSTPEEFWFIGAKNERVHGWIVPPVNKQANTKYPVAFLVHGGPQSAWLDSFSTRWNPQAYAGAELAVVAIDFHGSTSYGQDFTDAINGEWGSYPFEDLQIGLDYVIDNYDYVDSTRVVALGASYGGYMMNWINGNNEEGRFVCLVNHCGLSDVRSMYFTTEELFFPEYDMRGTPWESDLYDKWNPINLVTKWKTPTLVIHGAKDYRVVDGQGFITFTALQRQGVRSRLLYFPDENHWVLRPANTLRWMEEILDWIVTCTDEPKSVA